MQADGNKRIFQLQIAKAAKIHDMYTVLLFILVFGLCEIRYFL